MVIMSREDHEKLLVELVDSETTEARKFEIAQSLRNNDIEGHNEFEDMTNKMAEINETNVQLQQANNQLFRQQVEKTEEEQAEDTEEEKAETIKIEDFE